MHQYPTSYFNRFIYLLKLVTIVAAVTVCPVVITTILNSYVSRYYKIQKVLRIRTLHDE